MFSGLGRMVILVEDQEEALVFYRDVLGCTVLFDQTTDGFRFLHVGVPGQEDVGLWLMPAGDGERQLVGQQAGERPLLVFYTEDIQLVRERLVSHGVEIWAEREDPGSRSLHFRDLYGNVVIAAQLR
ncbi:VOC family protein [Phytoactinopolyspora halophila]|nr:VOC family protein [Phytoactinopolyspora halophila]